MVPGNAARLFHALQAALIQPVGVEENCQTFLTGFCAGTREARKIRPTLSDSLILAVVMPWRVIKQNDGTSSPGHTARNPIEVQLHAVRADKRESGACDLVSCGTDCPKQTGVGIALAGCPFGLLPNDTVLLPDPRFVLEPDFDPFAAQQMAGVGIQKCQEVF